MVEGTAQLSEREQEILKLVATGATNQQIANELHISINTVKAHLRNIFDKVGATSRTEATMYAVRLGLVNVRSGTASDSLVAPGEPARTDNQPVVELENVPVVTEPVVEPPVVATVQAEAVTPIPPAVMIAVDQPVPARLPRAIWPIAMVVILLVIGLLGWQLVRARSTVNTRTVPMPGPDQWKARPALTTPRNSFAVASYEDRLYVIGGEGVGGTTGVVERFDLKNNTWVALSSKPTPVSEVQAVAIGGRIYVPGGEQASTVTTVFEVYDPRKEHWDKLADLPAPRSRYALAAVEGRLYLMGGWDGTHFADDVLIYSPDTGAWTQGAKLSAGRRNASAAVVENQIYLMGGENATGALQTVDRYDPTGGNGGQWQSLVPLPRPVAAPVAFGVLNGVLMFDPEHHSLLQYRPAADVWTTAPVPPQINLSNHGTALGSSLVLFGQSQAGHPNPVNEFQLVNTFFLPLATGQ